MNTENQRLADAFGMGALDVSVMHAAPESEPEPAELARPDDPDAAEDD